MSGVVRSLDAARPRRTLGEDERLRPGDVLWFTGTNNGHVCGLKGLDAFPVGLTVREFRARKMVVDDGAPFATATRAV